MKKLVALIILMVLSLAAFTACVTPEDKLAAKEGVTAAKTYVYDLYKGMNTNTAVDFNVVKQVPVEGVPYPVTWTVEITSGDAEGVKVVVTEDGKITIDVDNRALAPIEYVLTATVSDKVYGFKESLSFNFVVPKFEAMSFDQYVAAEDGTIVTVEGIVNSFLSKSLGDTTNGLYLNDISGVGGYYVYNIEADPKEVGYEVGDRMIITGEKDIYSGTLEIVKPSIEVVSKGNEVVAADYTEIYTDAESTKDADLVYAQAQLVTIKGVTVGGIDESSGYYKFSLAGKESYVRISSSSCPLDKDDTAAFKAAHEAHFGWIANVTGTICVYSGAFYLTPATVDAFEYVSLPELDDAGEVAFEKAALELGYDAITENTVITLPVAGQAYPDVVISWASNNDCAVVADGKLTITLPEEAATVTITATLTSGSASDTKTFELAVDAMPTDLYIPNGITSAPEAGKAYKFALNQANLGQILYFTGAISGKYLSTSDKADKAVDVYVEAVDGGYSMYFGETKQYINVTSGAITLDATASSVWTWNSELGILQTVSGTDTYYLGTYKTYNTISASKISYIDTSNSGVSQFPARLSILAPADYKFVANSEVIADKAFKFSLYQANLGARLYFTGAISGKYLSTSEKVADAVDVYVEAVDGGYSMYFGETKQYINVTSGAITLDATASSVWTWNSELGILQTVSGTDTYYLGTYKTYNTISASKISYIDTSNSGVSQFPAQLGIVELAEIAPVRATEAVVDKAFKFSLYQANLGQTLYFTGAISGKYLSTSDKISKAVDVYLATVEGGYSMYFMIGDVKTYINVTSGAITLNDTASSVWTWNSELGILQTVSGTDTYYLGTYKTYNTISASKISYIDTSNSGVSQFPACLVTIEFVSSEVHVHEFATEWSKDEDNHWHECACGEVADKAAHTYVEGVCECGAIEPVASQTTTIAFGPTNRTILTDTKHEYKVSDSNIVITHEKGTGSAMRTSDTDHTRFYQNSILTIAGEKITKIVVTCTSASYATALVNSLTENANIESVSADAKVVTVILNEVNSLTFTMSAQVRASSIVITTVA